MKELLKILLYTDVGSELNNWTLLGFRVLLAFELFRVHGLKKLNAGKGMLEQIPNPFGLPVQFNTLVATMSDTIVPFFVLVGLATRLAVIPVVGVTAVGYFVVHGHDSAQVRDVPYMYTISFLLLLFMGAGTLSIDYYLWLFLSRL